MKPADLSTLFTQNPIIMRSLGRQRTNWRKTSALILAVLVYCPGCMVFVSLSLDSYPWTHDATVGVSKITFYVTMILLLVTVALFAPTISASGIAGERQRQTLELLLVTSLPTHSIVLGKLIIALTYIRTLVVATLPIILFYFVIGGVSLIQLAIMTLILLITATAFTALGLYVSSLSKTITNAVMLSYGLFLPLVFIVPPLCMMVISLVFAFANVRHSLEYIVYGWALVISLNPLGAFIFSAIAYETGSGIILISIPPPTHSEPYYLLSPWLIFVIFYSFATLYLIQLTTKRLEKKGQ